MNEHQSGLALGTKIALVRKGRRQWAKLVRTIPNGEEWRIYADEECQKYIYTEGWKYVQALAIKP